MEKVKFNKRAGKETPVVRCVKSEKGMQFGLSISPFEDDTKGKLFVSYPTVFKPNFIDADNITYIPLKDWLVSKAI